MKLSETFKNYWQTQGLGPATKVQAAIFDRIQAGESFIVTSPTGSGKTLAYLLPLLQKLKADRTLQALVVAPSQELAVQIGEVAKDWGEELGLGTLTLIGGANFSRQIDALKDKPELVVATPGRLNQLAERSRKLNLHTVETVVYDEADFLLSEEHRNNTLRVDKRLRRSVNRIWLSATYGPELQALQAETEIPVYQIQEELKIQHWYLEVPNRRKIDYLRRLAQVSGMKALVFFEHIDQLDHTFFQLTQAGVDVFALHGKLNKFERQEALELFQEGALTFLLVTDVAARGLDLADTPYVIHFDCPKTGQDYQHRSGRTGRMGQSGTVLSLVNPHERQRLAEVLADLDEEIPLEERVLFHKELMTPVQREKRRAEEDAQAGGKARKKQKRKPAAKDRPKRKKNRQRQRKSKGKPRK